MAFELDFEKPLIDLERQIAHLKRLATDQRLDVQWEIAPLEQRLGELRREIYRDLPPMQRVQVARHPRRPYALDYLGTVFSDFIELKGEAPVPPLSPLISTTSACALATPAAIVPTPTSATSLTAMRASGLTFLRS